jgi:large subunit ribosomal protein L3
MLGVSVIDVSPNRVVARRTAARDGYEAVALGYGVRRASRVPKPQAKALEKAGVKAAPQIVHEFEIAAGADPKPGDELKLGDVFAVGGMVDVIGTSLGKGFAGVHKRHNFDLGPKTHGTKNIREHKSTGSNTWPSRRWPGTKMAGHMGAKRRTVRNLRVVAVDVERNLLLVNGPIPGSESGIVMVRHAVAKNVRKPAKQ